VLTTKTTPSLASDSQGALWATVPAARIGSTWPAATSSPQLLYSSPSDTRHSTWTDVSDTVYRAGGLLTQAISVASDGSVYAAQPGMGVIKGTPTP
jgi:hypothetical protein